MTIENIALVTKTWGLSIRGRHAFLLILDLHINLLIMHFNLLLVVLSQNRLLLMFILQLFSCCFGSALGLVSWLWSPLPVWQKDKCTFSVYRPCWCTLWFFFLIHCSLTAFTFFTLMVFLLWTSCFQIIIHIFLECCLSICLYKSSLEPYIIDFATSPLVFH